MVRFFGLDVLLFEDSLPLVGFGCGNLLFLENSATANVVLFTFGEHSLRRVDHHLIQRTARGGVA